MAMQGAGQRPTDREPMACLRAAVEAGPMTPDERAAFRSELARVRAEDESKRSAPHPQLPLDMAA